MKMQLTGMALCRQQLFLRASEKKYGQVIGIAEPEADRDGGYTKSFLSGRGGPGSAQKPEPVAMHNALNVVFGVAALSEQIRNFL